MNSREWKFFMDIGSHCLILLIPDEAAHDSEIMSPTGTGLSRPGFGMAASTSAGLFRVSPLPIKERWMPAERVAMRQAREIIQLKFPANITTRGIARHLGLAPSTVRENLKRFELSGLG